MSKNGFDKLAFLVALGATALVVLAAVGAGPAYSESRAESATLQSSTAEPAPAEAAGSGEQPEATTAEPQEEARPVDTEGYEWSGSRPADERYLWSHQTN